MRYSVISLATSERAHSEPRGQCDAQRTTLFEIVRGDDLRRENGIRRLGMRADDKGLCHGPQTPTGRDAHRLPGRIGAVAASANHEAVGPSVDPPKNRIIAAVEEILHEARKGGEILRRSEDIAVGCEHIVQAPP